MLVGERTILRVDGMDADTGARLALGAPREPIAHVAAEAAEFLDERVPSGGKPASTAAARPS
jgi:hypothetical protein